MIVSSLSSLLMSRIQVYGRRLTALILDSNTAQPRQESVSRDVIEARAYNSRDDSEDYDDDDDEEGGDDVNSNREIVLFGDNERARLASIKCHKPR